VDTKKARFLPFHAINEFMRPDFRLAVVRAALQAAPAMPDDLRQPLDRLVKKVVRVPGFRDGSKAPTPLKVRPTAEAFEKSPDLVGAVLAIWAQSNAELSQQVYDLLVEKGWEVLPAEANRAKLPGFMTVWPKGQDFEAMNQAYHEKYPQVEATSDDISLMVVWVSGRLPYKIEGEQEDASTEEQAEAAQDDPKPSPHENIF
jgi:hypothetical protein